MPNSHSHQSQLVADMLPNNNWVANISGSLTINMLAQYIRLWGRLQDVHLSGSVARQVHLEVVVRPVVLGALGLSRVLHRTM
jgi:hypothetical protein